MARLVTLAWALSGKASLPWTHTPPGADDAPAVDEGQPSDEVHPVI